MKVKIYNVTLLSIPNFWLTYYMYGLYHHPNVLFTFKKEKEFSEFDYTNRCALRITIKGMVKSIIIDTDDPTDRHDNLGNNFDCVFLSQKLITKSDNELKKIHALPPHFPIKTFVIHKMIAMHIFNPCNLIKNLKEIKAVFSLKPLSLVYGKRIIRNSNNFIFYHRSLWKKEFLTNELGYKYLTYFSRKKFNVEGGFYRSDGYKSDSEVINRLITNKKIPTSEYIAKSIESLFCFNSPAVRGAISWRFGEYLAMGKAVISTPFKVEFPEFMQNKISLFTINDNIEEFDAQLDTITKSSMQMIATAEDNNYLLFQQFLTPEKQITYILQKTFENDTF